MKYLSPPHPFFSFTSPSSSAISTLRRMCSGRSSSSSPSPPELELSVEPSLSVEEEKSLEDCESKPPAQEAKNRPNIDWQEKIHRGILRGLRNISETP